MTYKTPQIILHWLVFGLIAWQFIGHEPIRGAFDLWMKEGVFAP